MAGSPPASQVLVGDERGSKRRRTVGLGSAGASQQQQHATGDRSNGFPLGGPPTTSDTAQPEPALGSRHAVYLPPAGSAGAEGMGTQGSGAGVAAVAKTRYQVAVSNRNVQRGVPSSRGQDRHLDGGAAGDDASLPLAKQEGSEAGEPNPGGPAAALDAAVAGAGGGLVVGPIPGGFGGVGGGKGMLVGPGGGGAPLGALPPGATPLGAPRPPGPPQQQQLGLALGGPSNPPPAAPGLSLGGGMQLGGGPQGAVPPHHSTSGGGTSAVQGLSLGGGPGAGSSGSQPAPIMPGLGPAAAATLLGSTGLRHDGPLGKASGGGGVGAGGSTGGGGPGVQGILRPSGFVMGPPKEGYMRPEVVKLPLEVGARVAAQWRDGTYHMARVIERRPHPGATDPTEFDYYVHYVKFNRRMDEWVTQAQLDLGTVEVEVPETDPKKRKRILADEHDSDSDHGDFDVNALREHEEFTKVKNVEVIELGRHEMETWYFSPFPPEFKDCKKLYFCEYSLQYFKRRSQMLRHMAKLKVRHPPGDEIYRNGNVCFFEVDGKREKAWCQSLCFLAKLFLDHKTLYYDVDLFLFYVLCEIDERGAHIVGYFSKEKQSEEGYNLACILTLPAYQRKGYGKALISMSYELSKLEGKMGTPERPLSDLGRVSYHGYWTREILAILRTHEGPITIKEISDRTSFKPDDIELTLKQLGLVQMSRGQLVLVAAPDVVEAHLKKAGGPGLVIDASKIVWTPYNAEREYVTKGGGGGH